MSPSMDSQLRRLREALARIAAETFDPWAREQAKAALADTKPGA